jgi:predicted DNA-binding protein with PD1-like motif
MSIANSGGRVWGGHVLEGCVVHTTAEIVIGELAGVKFLRETDPETGHRELRIEPIRQRGMS